MALLPHSIDIYDWLDWKGDLPAVAQQILASWTQPGVTNPGHQLLGEQGAPMRVQLMKHVGGYGSIPLNIAQAQFVAHSMADLIEAGPVQVVYAGVNLFAYYGHLYQVTAVKMTECRVSPTLIGPGYSLTGGVTLGVNVSLHPHKL